MGAGSREGPDPDGLRARLPDHQRGIDWIDGHVATNPGRVVLVFLALSLVFGIGLGNVTTEAGTQQFTTGLPSEQALEAVDQEFSPAFAPDTGSTTLIQRGGNVLSKPALERMLELQVEITDRPGLRATDTGSAASSVALQLDPTATAPAAQLRAVERATPGEIDRAVRAVAARSERFSGLLSTDFNERSASASATIATVTHEVPTGIASGAGTSGDSPLTAIQQRIDRLAGGIGGDVTVFGSGVLAEEFSAVILDSLLIVVPAAVLFILLFLVVAYRDPIDLGLGMLSLGMAIVWTFGFMGLAGIPFSQMLIAVPPLLLAVGIDFGIHAINRYREERVEGADIPGAMRITTDQLVVAFFIVTGTTVIGFAANFTSALGPIRDFGFVAAIGIVFTFLIFGLFLPAAKVWMDRFRARRRLPTFASTPLGAEGTSLARVLRGGVVLAREAPGLFLALALVGSALAGGYATGVDTSFAQEDFLPPEDVPEFLEELPEPFRPSEYSVTGLLNFLEANFATAQTSRTTMYLEGPMLRETALESIDRAGRNPPAAFATDGRQSDARSILSVIRDRSAVDPRFASLVATNDRDGDGVPDDDLREVYDYLLSSSARPQALSFLGDDFRSARVVYTVDAEASQTAVEADARVIADRFRAAATPTGQTIVFQAVSDVILDSALRSLVVALVGASLFLVFIYWWFEGQGGLGVANMVPILVTVALLGATMRLFAIPFNAITATILAITIGLGIDYSVHVTHRFADERRQRPVVPALERTVRGTGGALLGSMLTTVSGIGVLALALFPAIGQFGVLTGLSIFYSFFASLVVLPSALVVWDQFANGDGRVAPLFGLGEGAWLDGESPRPPE
ncbi:MAG: MMPL family transporter [Haloarculaceae archaeon]